MPEFILNEDKSLHLDWFMSGYVEAMFFTNGDTGADNENLLNDLGTGRLTKKALASIEKDCRAFLGHVMPDGCFVQQWLDRVEDYDAEQAGRDFWFTRQGHGVGFWDRDVLNLDLWAPDTPAPGLGGWVVLDTDHDAEGYTLAGNLRDGLSAAAEAQGEAYCEVSRGWIYHI